MEISDRELPVWEDKVNNEFGEFFFKLNDGEIENGDGKSVVTIYTRSDETGEMERFDYFTTDVHAGKDEWSDFHSECLNWCIDLCLTT